MLILPLQQTKTILYRIVIDVTVLRENNIFAIDQTA